MRLIDADRLIKLLKEQKVKETGAYTKGINSGLNVAKCIINDNTVQSPIAYDIDKIVEELNELDVKSITRYKNGNFGNFDGVEYYIKKRKAIEIVKQGDVSEAEQKLKEMDGD